MVTVPDNFQPIGLPPVDIVDDVRAALRAAGFQDPDAVFATSTSISMEWLYDAVERRFSQKRISERSVPMIHRTLAQTLDPQPRTAEVLMRLLGWIDRVDLARASLLLRAMQSRVLTPYVHNARERAGQPKW